MSGIDLLRKIKARGVEWPVIVVTGHGDVTLAVEALRAGATEFVEKPYDADVLLNAIAAAIKRPTGANTDARAVRKSVKFVLELEGFEVRDFPAPRNFYSSRASRRIVVWSWTTTCPE